MPSNYVSTFLITLQITKFTESIPQCWDVHNQNVNEYLKLGTNIILDILRNNVVQNSIFIYQFCGNFGKNTFYFLMSISENSSAYFFGSSFLLQLFFPF